MNKGNLSYGLNARSGKGGTKKKKGLSGFGGGDDSDDNSSSDGNKSNTPGGTNARSSINKEIAAEQAALRKRAQSAMANASSSLDTNVYDYDAEYDTFSSGKKKLDMLPNRPRNSNNNKVLMNRRSQNIYPLY